ncbi:NUDIX hydrolase [Actinomyces faecalis]|uniref:NUDIX hydrolase n=1 Tax=Actinomyces faecalis TaxID=2722820 RepID=UPI001553BB8D|nr:NUDIX domain-containing protein [Actinomyces faecalis]
MSKQIIVSAVVMLDDDGRLLTVRKQGTHLFMFPGGKPEPGEDAAQTAARETDEELGIAVAPEDLQPLGTLTAPAANEAGHDVVAHVFAHPYVPGALPAHEITELRWTDLSAPLPDDLAPLTYAVIQTLRVMDQSHSHHAAAR